MPLFGTVFVRNCFLFVSHGSPYISTSTYVPHLLSDKNWPDITCTIKKHHFYLLINTLKKLVSKTFQKSKCEFWAIYIHSISAWLWLILPISKQLWFVLLIRCEKRSSNENVKVKQNNRIKALDHFPNLANKFFKVKILEPYVNWNKYFVISVYVQEHLNSHTYPDFKCSSNDAINSGFTKRVKVSVSSPHKLWLQQIACPAIVLKQAQVQLHS